MRVAHYIRGNASREIPHHILVVDTETYIERLKTGEKKLWFRLGCAIYLRRKSETGAWIESEMTFYSVDEFHSLLDSLMSGKRRLVIFAHNAGFDYTVLKMDTYISSRTFEIDMRVNESVFIVNAFKRLGDGTSSFSFVDTMNYYKLSLEKLGRIFGEYKGKVEDFENVSDIELAEYCMQDTRVLSVLVKKHIKFIEENNLGNFKLTIASQAFGAYRHRFMRNKILVHCYDPIIQMELESYRGGRCEAFRLGKFDELFKLDVNSMYPYVMKRYEYPNIIISKKCLDVPTDRVNEFLKDNLYVLADCKVELKKPFLAVKREKLLFPIGKVRQTLCSPEIEYLIENPDIGKIVSFEKVATYEKADLFSEYVDFFYGMRKSTDNPAIDAMCKLFLNSLYGKMGQRSMCKHILIEDSKLIESIFESMDSVGSHTMDIAKPNGIEKYIRLGEELYRIDESTDILAHDSCPIIASTVTAYSRNYLFSMMLDCGLENVFYCDTDSLFVNSEGYSNLRKTGVMSSDELGMMKLEESGQCEIFGAKNYVFNGKVKLKGVKKNAEIIGENTYRQEQFLTKNLRYRKGIEDGIVMVRPLVKHISTEYDKGIVKNGKVFPYVFDDFS